MYVPILAFRLRLSFPFLVQPLGFVELQAQPSGPFTIEALVTHSLPCSLQHSVGPLHSDALNGGNVSEPSACITFNDSMSLTLRRVEFLIVLQAYLFAVINLYILGQPQEFRISVKIVREALSNKLQNQSFSSSMFISAC